MFNYNLGSPPTELLGTCMYGQSNCFGNTYSNLYDTATNLGHTSPLPRRRYSIGGLPSASMTDYLTLMQNASEQAHLSNLLNETTRSINRSQQILDVGTLASDGITSYPTLDCGDLTTSYRTDNLLSMPIQTNFSSHPNIYSQPNYKSQSTFLDYLPKQFSNVAYSQPAYSNHRTTDHYLSTYPSNLFTQTRLMSQSRNHIPLHHASNPALSHTSNWYPSHLKTTTADTYNHHSLKYPFSSGYSNQHFDHHHYQIPKLDLDYTKQGETKRQVSFKFDVDTLSIDS